MDAKNTCKKGYIVININKDKNRTLNAANIFSPLLLLTIAIGTSSPQAGLTGFPADPVGTYKQNEINNGIE